DDIRLAGLDECMKRVEVPPISRSVIALRRASHGSQIRLIHELGGGNSAADRFGIGDEATRLIALPQTGCVPDAGTDCHRGYDPCVTRLGKVDDTPPALAA